MPGEIEIEEWMCLAELIDNAFDGFGEIMICIILEAVARRCRLSLWPASSLPPGSIPSPLLGPGALCWRCCCQPDCSAVL
jgi:hypothetical protein